MSLPETIERVFLNEGEEFILARDKKHAESLRVSAFNIRRAMIKKWKNLGEDIGIQKVEEDEKWFLRIFTRKIDEAEHWVRNESGKLVPMPREDPELTRTVALMRKDGVSEEAIEEYKKSYK